MTMTTAIPELADKQAITEAIYAYCRAVDRLDIPLGHSVWHADGVADYGPGQYQGPGRGVIDHICAQHQHLISHSHQVSNILIDLRGDAAGSEAYMTGTMRLERGGKVMQITVHARYIDLWERRDGRWGLIRRDVCLDHSELREVTPGPSLGIPPHRSRADPSYLVLGDAA
jgi:SnoaL-like domain